MRLTVDKIVNSNATSLLAAGEAAIRAGDCRFDLSAVKRCDSSAVALLLAWERAAQASGQRAEFEAVPACLTSLATLYGVEALISPPATTRPDSDPGH